MTDLLTRLESLLTPNADGLLPCPWCSNSDETKMGVNRWGVSSNEVVCECGARGPVTRGSDSRETAIAAWNSRPFIRALVEAVKQRDSRFPLEVTGSGKWAEREVSRLVAEKDAAITRMDAAILAILEGKP